jgi:hypothetical protein
VYFKEILPTSQYFKLGERIILGKTGLYVGIEKTLCSAW